MGKLRRAGWPSWRAYTQALIGRIEPSRKGRVVARNQNQEHCGLNQGLYPALKALALKLAGMHAFRRGCNRRWELAGINRAVLRQQMGHTSAAMTALYTGEIPLEHVQAECSFKIGNCGFVKYGK
jgi:integrase